MKFKIEFTRTEKKKYCINRKFLVDVSATTDNVSKTNN